MINNIFSIFHAYIKGYFDHYGCHVLGEYYFMADGFEVEGVSGPSLNAEKARLQQLRSMQRALNIEARQENSKSEFEEWCELSAFNPLAIAKKFETIEKRIRKPEKEDAAEEVDAEIETIDAVEKTAEDFSKKNPELKARSLLGLRSIILQDDSPETIISKLLDAYPDQFLADEALDFMLEVTNPNSKLGLSLRRAKELLFEKYNREITAGRNINSEAQEFSKQGLGNATGLRDLYREITGNPRSALNLFEELNSLFTFEKLKVAIKFILHSLGTDLKAKGPSISRAELQRLFSEARSMQAILGVYRFFNLRMGMIEKLFAKEDLAVPKRLSFELLAKQFMKLLGERYPSPDKVLKLAVLLGISEELAAQVIIFTQYRDAIRNVSPRLFNTNKHRQDLLTTLIETISELDDLLEEDEDEDEDEDDEDEDEPPQKHGWGTRDTIR